MILASFAKRVPGAVRLERFPPVRGPGVSRNPVSLRIFNRR